MEVFVQSFQLIHLLCSHLEVEDLEVLSDPLLCLGFGKRYKPALDRPSNQNLMGGFVVLSGQFLCELVVDEGRLISSQRRVCLNGDLARSAILDQLLVVQKGMEFELIHGWHHPSLLHDTLQVGHKEVAYSNIPDLILPFQLNQSFPGIYSVVNLCLIRWVNASKSRPVNQQQIQILGSQVLEYLIASTLCILVSHLHWPYFAGDVNGLSRDVGVFYGS